MSEVTPAGVVSTLVGGFDDPAGLVVAGGNLYVANLNVDTAYNPARWMSSAELIAVPFTLGGSATSGVAFSGVTAGPLLFGVGQTTVDITGTLLSDPGPNQTLTFTLGTPIGGAVLGSPSTNTLTINESGTTGTGTGRALARPHPRRSPVRGLC